jgi:hypothetical protein
MIRALQEQIDLTGVAEYLGYKIVLLVGDRDFGGISYQVKANEIESRFGDVASAVRHVYVSFMALSGAPLSEVELEAIASEWGSDVADRVAYGRSTQHGLAPR